MIELIPAIDIIDGKCVRLTKGDYDTKTVYADDPVEMAIHFEKTGPLHSNGLNLPTMPGKFFRRSLTLT